MGTRLYVGNLPFSAEESELRSLFEQNGRTVEDIKLITDRETGRPRGFGFVEMSNSEEADAAIQELNGYQMAGRQLTVNEAPVSTVPFFHARPASRSSDAVFHSRAFSPRSDPVVAGPASAVAALPARSTRSGGYAPAST